MRKAAGAGLVMIIAAAASAGLAAGEQVALEVTPQVAFAPADVNVRVVVEEDANNRAVEVIADSTDCYRSSEIQLDGQNAPHLTLVVFRDMPSGRYEVRAVLKGSRGQELAATRTQLNVVSQ